MMSDALKARLRKQRKNRGVAMVEAAVILPVMVIFLVTMEYAHHMYDLKLTTLHEARERAWSYALEGCKDERDDASYRKPKYFTIDGSSSKDSGTTVGSATVHSASVSGSAFATRGSNSFRGKAKSTTTVYCNPPLGPRLKLAPLVKSLFSH